MSSHSPWPRALWAGAGVMSVAVWLALAARRPPLGPPATPPRVALIGDSYAVGLGPQLTRLLPDFQYEGHVGTSASQWAAHSPACGACGDWLTAYRPTVTLVSLGVNDGDVSNVADYRTIAEALRAMGSRVVWVEPPAGVRAPVVRQAIASLGVPTVPATSSPLAADGLHPQDYAGWAAEVARYAA